MPRKAFAHILLVLVNFFYGANFTISKLVMPAFILPQAFILIRVAVTTALFFLVGFFWGNEKVARRDLPLLAACGLFGVAINQEFFFAGLSITTPINGALIMIMTPILVMLISFFTGHEKLTWQKVTGMLTGAAGAMIIIGGRGLNFSSKTAPGDLLILLNASSYAIYLVMVRPLMHRYHPMTIIKWVFLLGLPWVLFFGAGQMGQIQWHSFSRNIWLAVVFVVFFTTFCAYLFNTIALREVHSSIVGAYIYLQPVIAALISTLAGKDELDPAKLLSAVLIFSGVYLVSFAGRKMKETEEEVLVLEE